MVNQLHIAIDESLRARLAAMGERYHLDEQGLLRRALEEFLERDEQRMEDEERWQEYLRTGKAISHEQVEAWMNEQIAALSAKHNPSQ